MAQETPNQHPTYLLVPEVAARFRVPESTVRHWISTRQLASIRVGKRRLISVANLDAFVAACAEASK